MNRANQVTNFVERIFDLYHLNKYGFFYESDDDTFEQYETPLFPSGEIDDATMNRLSIKLGLTPDEILSLDESAMYKYWTKYPFFKLYDLFLETWAWNCQYQEKPSPAQALLFVFDKNSEIAAQQRYDYKSVKERMLKLLKEMDVFLPGTFHPDATVTNLTIETEVLFSFPEITEMIRSYINMVEKAKVYFFKALKEQLSQDEVNEYNFLVNVLQITDVVMPSTLLTYDNVCIYKQAYIEEGFEDFFSYAKVRSFVGTGELCQGINPWRCKEFFDDMELVNKLAYIFPAIKEQMRKFAMRVKNFQCTFVWSDANCITNSDVYEQDLFGFGKSMSYEEGAKEPTIVYVNKTQEELYDWESYIDKVSYVTSPPSKGGFKIRPIDMHSVPPYSFKRMQRRVELKNGGNV